MFKNITIKNFRGIENLTIEDFGKVNLLVGANNSCKTSVLEALYVVEHWNKFDPILFISNGRKLHNCYFQNKFLSPIDESKHNLALIENSLKTIFYNTDLSKAISLQSSEKQLSIEALTEIQEEKDSVSVFQREKLIGLNFSSKTTKETATFRIYDGNQGGEYLLYDSEGKKKTKNLTRLVNSTQKESNQFQNKQQDNMFFRSSSFNLVEVSNSFKLIEKYQTSKKRQIINNLQKLETSILDIRWDDDEGAFFIEQEGLEEQLRLETSGDGLLKAFALMCYLITLKDDSICFIDEIENGLHYTSQSIIWEFLFDTAKERNIQIFATTHSIDAVRAFTEVAKEKDEKDIRLFKLLKKDNKLKVYKSTLEGLEFSTENNWEIR